MCDMKLLEIIRGACRSFIGVGLACAVLQLVGCAGAPTLGREAQLDQTEPASLEANWGIKVEGLRLSAAGSMLDFRYRVLDPAKAAPLLDGKSQVYLMDDTRGAKLGVPDTPVLGRIRQTARNGNILTDRTYFIMFGNPGKALKSGDKVTLLLGQAKVSDLMVQ
jgi:hypothetical protein